jgi:CheY-like chemotaxis protein
MATKETWRMQDKRGKNVASKPTVLIVDDEPSIRKMINEVLSLEGYPVASATNGREALDALKSGGPRVILLDILMPVLDGEGFLKELEANPAQRSQHRVILMSANPRLEQYNYLTVEGRLPKPFTVDQLINAITVVGVPA